MFRKIHENIELSSIISQCCSENNIEVCLSEGLENCSDDRLLILKPDNYYSSRNMQNPPPAIDCIILVKCSSNESYNIYLIELKDIKSPQGFNKANIVAKFRTVINDFLSDKFKDIFLKESYCDFNCYFISNPYGFKDMTQTEYDKKIHDEGLKLDYFNSIKPFKFNGKVSLIQSRLPSPMVSEC